MSIISEEDLEKIKKTEGEIIGSSLKCDREFIIEREGREGLKKIEEEMEKLGYHLTYEEIDKYKWYPVQQDIISLLLAQKIFNWDDEIIREWGRWGAKTNFIVKLLTRLISKQTIVKSAPKLWRKYYTVGELDIKLDFKKRIGIATLKNFILYSVHRHFLEGYFYQIMSLIVPSRNLKVGGSKSEEPNVHQFEISW
jgi:hypothetical protein